MKKIVAIILLLALQCSSIQTIEQPPEVSPELQYGCASYTGKDWEKCIVKLVGKLQDISNKKPTKKLLEENRISENWVVKKYSLCFGDDSICAIETQNVYDPTLWAKVRPYLVTGSITIGIGFLLGVSASSR